MLSGSERQVAGAHRPAGITLERLGDARAIWLGQGDSRHTVLQVGEEYEGS